jgi:lysophospholipase L1-like esterase
MKYLFFLIIIPFHLFSTIKVAFVGDSISIGHLTTHFYLDILQERYEKEGKDILLMNRSYGGAFTDTLQIITINILTVDRPDYIIYLMGLNDAIADLPENEVRQNFDKAFSRIGGNCKKYILGMMDAPPKNPLYIYKLENIYKYLVQRYPISLYPKLIFTKQVWETARDQIHPNAIGHQIMADIIYEALHEVGAY